MTVARISIMRTSSSLAATYAAKKAEAEQVLDQMEELMHSQPGYIMGFRFTSREQENEIGRISLWRSHEDADHAAMLERMIALRSHVHRLIDPGHIEILVDVTGNPRNIPAPHR